MIDEEETFRRFGYRSTELTSGSGKKVVAVCDGKNCGLTREVKMQDYRDLCHKCATTRANNSRVYTDKILEEMRMTHTGLKHTDKTKKKISKAMMGHEVSQDTRKKHRAAVLGENNPRFGVESSEKTKKKISDSAKKRWEEMSPEIRKAKSNFVKKRWREMTLKEREEYRILMSCGHQGISVEDFEGFLKEQKYCNKFDEQCREHNREKYDRKCFLCGKLESENGSRLSVHHEDMNKNQGCNGHDWKLVPLCKICHGKTMGKKNEELWYARIMYLREHVWNDVILFIKEENQIKQ